ncbi:MAG: HEAT repeat domain-containing protein [Acidimicrobiia bacterium]
MTRPGAETGQDVADAHERAAAAAARGILGSRGAEAPRHEVIDDLLPLVTDDPSPLVRCAALGALVRLDATAAAVRSAWTAAATDPDAAVRRRATDTAPEVATGSVPGARVLLGLLDDEHVAEGAAWALGELGATAVSAGAVARLASVAVGHDDALVRESAVAALGALGHPDGLEAILSACRDKPAVRRRAVLALAPFDGDAVDVALAAAAEDRDWQVRQAAEDLGGGVDDGGGGSRPVPG